MPKKNGERTKAEVRAWRAWLAACRAEGRAVRTYNPDLVIYFFRTNEERDQHLAACAELGIRAEVVIV